jgi:hypothetical protein
MIILLSSAFYDTGKANKNVSERNLQQSLCRQTFFLTCFLFRMV